MRYKAPMFASLLGLSLLLAASAGAATLPAPNIDSFALFALQNFRSHHLEIAEGDIGVNDGVLRARGGLFASRSTIVADIAQLGPPSSCAALVSNLVRDGRCATPETFDGVWLDDPVAACGFQPFADCATQPGSDIVVDEGGRATLSPGNYGFLRVRDGATVRLQSGTFRFCGVRLGKEVRLIPEGPARVNVAGDLRIGDRSNVGTAANGVSGDVQFFTTGRRVDLQKDILVLAELCAPNATIWIRNQASLHGRFVGRQIRAHDVSARRSRCGDGHREGAEQCDGTDFGDLSCSGGSVDGGFAALSTCPLCRPDCTADTSCCPGNSTTTTTSISNTTTTTTTLPVCGDGVIGGDEECDGDDLGGALCGSAGGAVVVPDCPVCVDCRIDRACCTPPTTTTTTLPIGCGDGIRQGNEECDGLDLGGVVCAPTSSGGGFPDCVACLPNCTIDRSCCQPILPPEEICGDCTDNDGDGLVDFEDPDCCASTSALTVRRISIRRAGKTTRQRLRLKARFATRVPAGFNPRLEGTTLQISDRQGTVFCEDIPFKPDERWEAMGVFPFRDKSGTLAGGLKRARFHYRIKKQGPAVLEARGKNMSLRAPANNPVRITVRVGSQCARVLTTLQAKGRQGGLVFP